MRHRVTVRNRSHDVPASNQQSMAGMRSHGGTVSRPRGTQQAASHPSNGSMVEGTLRGASTGLWDGRGEGRSDPWRLSLRTGPQPLP